MKRTIEDVLDYLDGVLTGFERDPADTPFQSGFEAAYLELENWIEAGENIHV